MELASKIYFWLLLKPVFHAVDYVSVYSSEPIKWNEWTHLAVTYGNGQASFYLNGKLTGTIDKVATGSDIPQVTNSNKFGASDYGNPNSNAVISSFKIFNRVLSIDEILLHQNPIQVYVEKP